MIRWWELYIHRQHKGRSVCISPVMLTVTLRVIDQLINKGIIYLSWYWVKSQPTVVSCKLIEMHCITVESLVVTWGIPQGSMLRHLISINYSLFTLRKERSQTGQQGDDVCRWYCLAHHC